MWLRTICSKVHAVDMVRTDHNHDVRLGVMDEVQRLVDRVGAPRNQLLLTRCWAGTEAM